MASIKNTISISGGIVSYLIVTIYRTTAPAAELARVVYTSGVSSNPFQYEFTGLSNGTYIVKIHESTDGVTLGTLRHDFWIDAATGTTLFERVFFTVGSGVGAAPANGDTSYVDATLAGKTITGVFQRGFGFHEDAVEWAELPGGGFELIGGAAFSDGEVWCFEIVYVSAEVAPIGDDTFSVIEILSADTTLNSTHYNKTLLCNTPNATQTVTLPSLASVPDGKGFLIAHDGGSAVNVTVTGGTYRFRGSDATSIILAKGEKLKLIKKTVSGVPKWYVTDEEGQFHRVGEKIGVDVVGDNMLVCDGSEYDGLVYKRMWDFITNRVPASQKVTYAGFDTSVTINGESVFTKRGFYAVDLINSKFKVPDLRNQSRRFVKNIGGADASRVDNLAGGYQHWAIGPHTHAGGVAAHVGAGGYIDGWGGNNAPGSDNYDPATTGSINAGGENTVRNIGEIPVVLI